MKKELQNEQNILNNFRMLKRLEKAIISLIQRFEKLEEDFYNSSIGKVPLTPPPMISTGMEKD